MRRYVCVRIRVYVHACVSHVCVCLSVCVSVFLSVACLSVACLSGACLSGACLSGACLSGACLSGACLSGACLSGACLSGACLSVARVCVRVRVSVHKLLNTRTGKLKIIGGRRYRSKINHFLLDKRVIYGESKFNVEHF